MSNVVFLIFFLLFSGLTLTLSDQCYCEVDTDGAARLYSDIVKVRHMQL